MPCSTPTVSLRSVGICFRSRSRFHGRTQENWALNDISFDVYPGETIGIIGNNGAGKTTLLKAIAGIIEPDRGNIERGEINLSMLSLQVGFVPQLSGHENAILSGMLLGLDRAAAEQRVGEIEAFADLGEYFNKPLATYSAGMRARLGFSCALYSAAAVLLIDEVLGVGDQDFRVKSNAAIKALIQSNRTVLLASHNLATLSELCDRVVWIDKGTVRAAGKTAEILKQYAR